MDQRDPSQHKPVTRAASKQRASEEPAVVSASKRSRSSSRASATASPPTTTTTTAAVQPRTSSPLSVSHTATSLLHRPSTRASSALLASSHLSTTDSLTATTTTTPTTTSTTTANADSDKTTAPPLAAAPPTSRQASKKVARQTTHTRSSKSRKTHHHHHHHHHEPAMSFRSQEDDEDHSSESEPSQEANSFQAFLSRLHARGGDDARRLFGMGSSSSSSSGGRFSSLLQSLRSDSEPVIEVALNELSQTLLMGNEDSLGGFRPDQFVPILHEMLNMEHNPQLAITACRCLTNMLDAIPGSSSSVATCIPALCSKLLCIEYIDLAEQSLVTIGKLATEQGAALLSSGALMASLTFMEFFPIHLQRDAVNAAAAICRHTTPATVTLVRDSVPILCNLLSADKDKQMRESACTALERIAVGLRSAPAAIASLATTGGVVESLVAVLSTVAPREKLFTSALRALTALCRGSGSVQASLLSLRVVPMLHTVLLSDSFTTAGDQLSDIVSLFSELLPPLPTDLFYTKHCAARGSRDNMVWEWRGDDDNWLPYMSRDATRLEAAYQSGMSSTTLLIAGQPYSVRFDQMMQSNRLSGNQRPIRRVDATLSESGAGGAGAASGSGSGTPRSISTGPSSNGSGGDDERGAYLIAHPEHLQAMCDEIMPPLYDVLSSCGSITIRRRVLEALLRLISAAPPTMLADSMRTIAVSSQLAQLLASIDPLTAAAALQMVQLLVTKLPDVFNVFFRRKGVVFGVSKLAVRDRSGSTTSSTNRTTTTTSTTTTTTTTTTTSSSTRLRRSRMTNSTDADTPTATPTPSSTDPNEEFAAVLATQAAALLATAFSLPAEPYDPFADPHPALNELRNLRASVDGLLTATPGPHLSALAQAFASPDRTPSPFELEHSGAIPALLRLLTENTLHGTDIATRARLFLTHVAVLPNAYAALVSAVQDALLGLSAFAQNENRDRQRDLSALSAPIKLRLERAPSETTLREFNQAVMIEPLAPIQAIDDFLWSRVKPSDSSSTDTPSSRPRLGRYASGDDDSTGASEEDMFGRSPMSHDADMGTPRSDILELRSVGGAETRASALTIPESNGPRLALMIGGQVLPPGMSVFQAASTYGPGAGAGAGAGAMALGASPASHSALAAMLMSSLSSLTCTIQYRAWTPADDAAPVSGDATSMDVSNGLGPLEASIVTPSSASSILPYGSENVIHPLGLLRALHGVVFRVALLHMDPALVLHVPPPTAFLNPGLASKVMRQVCDFDSVCQGNAPAVCRAVMAVCPFVCPFESRLRYLHYTAFGAARALQRFKADSGAQDETSSRDRRRLTRAKVRLSRDRLLDGTMQVMDQYASVSAMLEFEFTNEHGTGLGPTLEFYALASQQFQKASLHIWRPSKDSEAEFVFHPEGLYPLPMKTAPQPILRLFETLGKLMARAILDGRMVDIIMSNAFYAWLEGEQDSLGFNELQVVDGRLYASMLPLHELWVRYQSTGGINKPEEYTINGATVDDMYLTFTLPGFADYELIPGGADIMVTLPRLGEYIDLITAATLRDGVRAQMQAYVRGFNTVLSVSKLSLFSASEMDRLFCGLRYHPWEISDLSQACRPEHGYTSDSAVVQWLFEELATFDSDSQRAFVSFITGCPNLPIGGFRGLKPSLTIVPKSRGEEANDDLPSVMTCQNYLKLPEYRTRARLAERLRLAMSEGQGSFLLS